MKRKYFFLIATLLICGMMNAQENHYMFNYHYFAHKITIVAQINIDGVDQRESASMDQITIIVPTLPFFTTQGMMPHSSFIIMRLAWN